MLHRIRARKPGSANRFVVSDRCLPQTIDVVRGRAAPVGPRAGGRRPGFRRDRRGHVRCAHPVPGRGRRRRGSVRRRCPCASGRRVRRGRQRPARAHPADAAGRVGRGRGGRQRAALRRTARLRRAASRLLRDAAGACAPDSRPLDRRVGGCARPDRVPHGAPDARAAHPARAGHLEHLHGAGAAGETLPGSTPYITVPKGSPPSPGAVHGLARRLARELARLGVSLRHGCFFDTLRVGVGSAAAQGRVRRCGGDGRPQLPLRRRDGHRHRARRNGGTAGCRADCRSVRGGAGRAAGAARRRPPGRPPTGRRPCAGPARS